VVSNRTTRPVTGRIDRSVSICTYHHFSNYAEITDSNGHSSVRIHECPSPDDCDFTAGDTTERLEHVNTEHAAESINGRTGRLPTSPGKNDTWTRTRTTNRPTSKRGYSYDHLPVKSLLPTYPANRAIRKRTQHDDDEGNGFSRYLTESVRHETYGPSSSEIESRSDVKPIVTHIGLGPSPGDRSPTEDGGSTLAPGWRFCDARVSIREVAANDSDVPHR